MRLFRRMDGLLARHPLATTFAVAMVVSLLGVTAMALLGDSSRCESPSLLLRNESRNAVRIRLSDGSAGLRIRAGGSIDVRARTRSVRVTATFASGSEPWVDVELPATVVATPREALIVVD